MLKLRHSGWLTSLSLFLLPILSVFYLGSQAGYRGGIDSLKRYQQLPEITRLADLEALPPGEIVLLRGRISKASPLRADPVAPDLIIYRERPAAGREVRYEEDFPQVMVDFSLDFPDGSVTIIPNQSREPVIRQELHQVPAGDRVRTGFRLGDIVTVQGEWQPQPTPTLVDTTGVSGADRAALLADWQVVVDQIGLLRDTLGWLTLLTLIIFLMQVHRARKAAPTATMDGETCPPQTPETIPTTSTG